jgi:hypothetical protein
VAEGGETRESDAGVTGKPGKVQSVQSGVGVGYGACRTWSDTSEISGRNRRCWVLRLANIPSFVARTALAHGLRQ